MLLSNYCLLGSTEERSLGGFVILPSLCLSLIVNYLSFLACLLISSFWFVKSLSLLFSAKHIQNSLKRYFWHYCNVSSCLVLVLSFIHSQIIWRSRNYIKIRDYKTHNNEMNHPIWMILVKMGHNFYFFVHQYGKVT